MLHFDDHATVTGQFQAHTFEDRVLKLDRICVGAHSTVATNAMLLYGAVTGRSSLVLPHSVVMKAEELTDGLVYTGAPARAACQSARGPKKAMNVEP